MKYFKSTNKVRIEPEDTVSQLATVTHSTVEEWIIFLESLINDELEEWKIGKGSENN